MSEGLNEQALKAENKTRGEYTVVGGMADYEFQGAGDAFAYDPFRTPKMDEGSRLTNHQLDAWKDTFESHVRGKGGASEGSYSEGYTQVDYLEICLAEIRN